jgi:hypothetical protein
MTEEKAEEFVRESSAGKPGAWVRLAVRPEIAYGEAKSAIARLRQAVALPVRTISAPAEPK